MKKSKTEISDDVELNEAHNKKMQKIKEARDKMMSGKTKEKGLIIVHTGSGKGKSSSGFGMSSRVCPQRLSSRVSAASAHARDTSAMLIKSSAWCQPEL